ncbi:hypothetical protein GCM10008995_03890 [Halobellus salinus]|uniref:DUF4268 domain-containing protein n=1 Tax=Halobellus salinus TaxID=931585 RepID=A0A830ECL6_9EURY|nr:DUF4268 domain-containing protein [Halobellus salinus]GGI97146.1 hypothetical protein GCM10008995_03890 [Halobellus salinus]SMP13911.1 protein of unknown function [Halobellus salinus]
MDWNVSRIREHNLRSVWENEERDFTRWLTENIGLLASELGIEIEDTRAEEAVGDFSADIVAREMNTGETVVIENQYGKTDHDHLGKLLTYSSGKNAGFTMWLAEEFRPEHRSVLEWLNETGPKGVKFFAIKPRVVSIEGSEERGFEFEVVVEPNEWERGVSDGSFTDTEQSYRQFFVEMVDAYSQRRPNWYKLKPGPRNYLTFSAGISGVRFGWVFHQGPEFSVELYISTSNKERNEEVFEALKREQTRIEENLGVELEWERLPQKQACRIKRPEEINGTITELTADQREYLVEWGVNAMDEFQEDFEPRLSALGSN